MAPASWSWRAALVSVAPSGMTMVAASSQRSIFSPAPHEHEAADRQDRQKDGQDQAACAAHVASDRDHDEAGVCAAKAETVVEHRTH